MYLFTTTITSANLKLYSRINGQSVSVGAYQCSNSWSENAITWNSTPAADSTPADTVSVVHDETWYSWDATGSVQDSINDNISIMLKSERTEYGYEYLSFNSKEHHSDALRPKLEITYTLSCSCSDTHINITDSDGDGVIDILDWDNSTPSEYWTDSHGRGRMWGDMNGDGELTSADALMILQAAVGSIDLHIPQPPSEIEIAYDDGSAEGGWSIGSGNEICSEDGGNRGYAIRMTTPDTEPFTITAIKLFSRRYEEDCNTRFEIWDHDRNTLYSDVVSHSEYSTAVDSWDSATWGYKGVPNIVVSGDFYIAMYTDATDPDDEVYPDTGVYVGYDTSFSSDRSYTVQGKTLTWDLSTPQETTNWMIRAVGTK